MFILVFILNILLKIKILEYLLYSTNDKFNWSHNVELIEILYDFIPLLIPLMTIKIVFLFIVFMFKRLLL